MQKIEMKYKSMELQVPCIIPFLMLLLKRNKDVAKGYGLIAASAVLAVFIPEELGTVVFVMFIMGVVMIFQKPENTSKDKKKKSSRKTA